MDYFDLYHQSFIFLSKNQYYTLKQMYKKEQARQVYKNKAVCSQHEKDRRIKAQREGEFDFIKELTAYDLLNLLENKYDSIVQKKQQMFAKFNQLILQRIVQIKSQFLKQCKKDITNFIVQGDGKFGEAEYKNLMEQRIIKTTKDITAINAMDNGLRFIKITIFINSQNRQTKMFCCDDLTAYDHSQIDIKRFKKDSIDYLTRFVEMLKNVQKAISNSI